MELPSNRPSLRRLVVGVLLVAGAAGLLSLIRVDEEHLARVTVVRAGRQALADLPSRATWHGEGELWVRVVAADPAWQGPLEEVVTSTPGLKAWPDATSTLRLSVFRAGATLSVEGVLEPPADVAAAAVGIRGGDRAADWTALLPPVLAILLAVVFRRLIVALFLAVWLGAALHRGVGPPLALWHACKDYVWANLTDTFNVFIFLFTFSLVGMVGVLTRMGGIHGLVEAIARRARSAAGVRLATALMGIAIFFDDYANTVVVGTTMQPLTDRLRISREKLAYLVDSTAAPIAGIAVISTWIGFEVEQ